VKIDPFFFQEGFIKSKSDLNIYIKKYGNENVALILLYVDDLIIIGCTTKLIDAIKRYLSWELEMKDIG
jgi:hypothetical protein